MGLDAPEYKIQLLKHLPTTLPNALPSGCSMKVAFKSIG